MYLMEVLHKKQMSIYRLAKISGVPYATLNDICRGRAKLEKCSAETVYRISHALNISMEQLLGPCFIQRSDFENFKSTICQRVKEMGDIDFLVNTIRKEDIRTYYDWEWYPESLYLLGMIDYLSRVNDIPLDREYDDIRKCKLKETIYPQSILAIAAVEGNDSALKEAKKEAIPEFLRFNIVESEIRNVA